MSGVRNRPKGARFAFFGLGLCAFALTPTEVGYQDIGSLLARQPGVAERWQKRVFSAVSTIQVATYSFGRPLGTSSPQASLYQLASFQLVSPGNDRDVTGSINRNPLAQVPPRYQASDFPKVDRTLKGDRLVIPPRETTAPVDKAPALEDPSTSNASVRGAKTAEAAKDRLPLDPELREALSAPPLPQYDVSLSLEAQPLDDLKAEVVPLEPVPSHDGFSVKTASLFFGSSSLGAPAESMESWQPGEAPTVVTPEPDPDMKMASLAAGHERSLPKVAKASRPKARSTPTISTPRRRPSDSACSTRSRAPGRKNASQKRFTSKPAAKRCAARSRWRRW